MKPNADAALYHRDRAWPWHWMLAWADVTLVMSRMTIAKTATGHPPPGHRLIEMDGTSRAMTQTGPAFASSEPKFATSLGPPSGHRRMMLGLQLGATPVRTGSMQSTGVLFGQNQGP